MASIIRRGDAWRAMIRRRGQSLTRTFDTEADAEAWATREEARIMTGATAPQIVKMPSSLSVAALFDRYAREVSPGKGGARWEEIRLKRLAKDFLGIAAELDGAGVAEWRDKRLLTVSASTVNRELNLISAVFTRAIKEWRLPMAVNPVHVIQRPKMPHNRTRRVPDVERVKIIAGLGWKQEAAPANRRQWVAWSFCVALETMMRTSEILRLTWGNVHTDRKFCHLPKTKNGHTRDVPLSTKAVALFAMLTPRSADARVVPVIAGTFGAYFRKATKGANIQGLHFHDTRREALTRTAKKLTNVLDLARASGHRNLKQLLTYYEPEVEEMAGLLD